MFFQKEKEKSSCCLRSKINLSELKKEKKRKKKTNQGEVGLNMILGKKKKRKLKQEDISRIKKWRWLTTKWFLKNNYK